MVDEPRSPRVVVIGAGNPFRADDGAGWHVVALAEPRLPSGVVVHRLDGEAARLIEAWTGADLAIVVDAAAGTPGEVRVTEVSTAPVEAGSAAGNEARSGAPESRAGRFSARAEARSTSSHTLGIAEAVALARALERLPRRLVVVTVGGRRFDEGAGLSPEVEAAAAVAADHVAAVVAGTADRVRSPESPM